MPKLDGLLFAGVEFVAVACLAALAILCLFQVLTRFVINVPAVWTEPTIRLLLVWSTFLGAAILVRHGMLIAITFLRDRAKGRLEQVLNIVAMISGMIFFGCAAWFGFKLIGRVQRQILSGLDISIAWAYLAVPVGAVFCLLALVLFHLRVNVEPEDATGKTPSDEL